MLKVDTKMNKKLNALKEVHHEGHVAIDLINKADNTMQIGQALFIFNNELIDFNIFHGSFGLGTGINYLNTTQFDKYGFKNVYDIRQKAIKEISQTKDNLVVASDAEIIQGANRCLKDNIDYIERYDGLTKPINASDATDWITTMLNYISDYILDNM